MKHLLAILCLGFISTTTLARNPVYVGEIMKPNTRIALRVVDAPTKGGAFPSSDGIGNVLALFLKGSYAFNDNVEVRAGLPAYFQSRNTTGQSESDVGNVYVGAMWNDDLAIGSDNWAFGYTAALDVYFPTSREATGLVVAQAFPSLDFYKFVTKAISVHPMIGMIIDQKYVSLKYNVGIAYSHLLQTSGLPTDQNRITFDWQSALTWHAMDTLNVAIEYNTISLDIGTVTTAAGAAKFRHSLTPSLSSWYKGFEGMLFANVPLDKSSRNLSNLAMGVNLAYLF